MTQHRAKSRDREQSHGDRGCRLLSRLWVGQEFGRSAKCLARKIIQLISGELTSVRTAGRFSRGYDSDVKLSLDRDTDGRIRINAQPKSHDSGIAPATPKFPAYVHHR